MTEQNSGNCILVFYLLRKPQPFNESAIQMYPANMTVSADRNWTRNTWLSACEMQWFWDDITDSQAGLIRLHLGTDSLCICLSRQYCWTIW